MEEAKVKGPDVPNFYLSSFKSMVISNSPIGVNKGNSKALSSTSEDDLYSPTKICGGTMSQV